MKVKVEVIYWLVLEADSEGEARNIAEDLRMKHPQTAETIAPDDVFTWKMRPTLADVDPAGAAVVRADCGPKRRRGDRS